MLVRSLNTVPPAQLEPRSSETSRPRGFVLRWRRDSATYPVVSQRFAAVSRPLESLLRRRARPVVFIRSALRRSNSGPGSRLSLRLVRPGLSRGCERSFGRNLPGLGSEREGITKRWTLGNLVEFAETRTYHLLASICSEIGHFYADERAGASLRLAIPTTTFARQLTRCLAKQGG